ncbi:DUF465 domain-containing protein [bacterium]|nr:DUF465 domain-containing protein [bacterium]
MRRINHLKMMHKMLDDQIDELERKHKFPDAQEEKMIADLKKQRLNIRDGIIQLEAEDAELDRHKTS